MTALDLKKELLSIAQPDVAVHSQRFFKTGSGEYGEGDRFLGIRVPEQRKKAQKYIQLPLDEIKKVLHSEFHEERLTALLILVYKYPKAPQKQQKEIFDFYMENLKWINNWDLIDSSAPKIVGPWLLNRPKDILYSLAKSDNLWKRRIAIMATFYFIKEGEFKDTFNIAEILLNDDHDLIHKASGWMLREVGKRNEQVLESFLKSHYPKMPRTMLRYAIEKLPESKRRDYLK